jgi:mandelamide amidase
LLRGARELAGKPVVSLPVVLTKRGAAIGIAIDGPANSDRQLPGIALTLERILGRLPAPSGL